MSNQQGSNNDQPVEGNRRLRRCKQKQIERKRRDNV